MHIVSLHAPFQCARSQVNEELRSQIGQSRNTNLQGQKIELQTFDGIMIKHDFHLRLQQMLHLKKHSSRLQLRSNSQCVQQQLWCMDYLPSIYLQAVLSMSSNSWESWVDSASTRRAASVSTARISRSSQLLEPRRWESFQSTWSNSVFLAPCCGQCSLRRIQVMPTFQCTQSKKLVANFEGKLRLRMFAEHHRYLEKLQLDLNTLRLWSSGIQDEIMDEAQRSTSNWWEWSVSFKGLNNPQPWVEGWLVASSQAQPPPNSASPSSTGLPAKAAPVSRAPQKQSSSMASAPRNPPFPNEQGADPWAKRKPSQKRVQTSKWASEPAAMSREERVRSSESEWDKPSKLFWFSNVPWHKALEGGVSSIVRAL